jgi:hypothetical protein
MDAACFVGRIFLPFQRSDLQAIVLARSTKSKDEEDSRMNGERRKSSVYLTFVTNQECSGPKVEGRTATVSR